MRDLPKTLVTEPQHTHTRFPERKIRETHTFSQQAAKGVKGGKGGGQSIYHCHGDVTENKFKKLRRKDEIYRGGVGRGRVEAGGRGGGQSEQEENKLNVYHI